MVHFLRALVHGVECPAVTQANAEHLTVLFAPKRCRTVTTYGTPCPVKTHLHETGVNVWCKIKEPGGTILVARLSYELRRNGETGDSFLTLRLALQTHHLRSRGYLALVVLEGSPSSSCTGN